MLKALPHDGPAERDAGRAASAAGQFEYAAEALEKAHHFEGHKPDPELHYLRGEALFTLGRDEQAFREHRIAELEIGPNPTERMEKLWLARIYARRGYVVLSDRLYETMQPPPPKFDEEVCAESGRRPPPQQGLGGRARASCDATWRSIPRTCAGGRCWPGRWRRTAISTASWRCAGAWSRITRPPRTSATTDGRSSAPPTTAPPARSTTPRWPTGRPPTTRWCTSYDRMHFRVTPELSGGGWVRSDPQAWDWRLQAGGALPFGTHHQAGLLFWHDTSTDWSANQVVGANVLRETGSVTGLGGYVMFGRRSGASAAPRGRQPAYPPPAATTRPETSSMARRDQLAFGGQSRARRARLALRAGEPAHRSERAVERRAGDHSRRRHADRRRSATSICFPRAASSCVDTGAHGPPAQPAAAGGRADPTPTANQLLTWAGLDFNLWTDSTRLVRGETLDERMVRRTALTDAGVLAYRHYENFANLSPELSHRAVPARLDRQRHLHPPQGALGRAQRRRAARRDRLRQHPGPAAGAGRRRRRGRLILVDTADGQLRLHTPERHDRAFPARSRLDGSPSMQISSSGPAKGPAPST